MFQPPALPGPEALCDLLAAAGCDGVQWTVRPGGHVEPSRAKEVLPRLARIAASRGLECRTICTAIADPAAPEAEELLRVAADCGYFAGLPTVCAKSGTRVSGSPSAAAISVGLSEPRNTVFRPAAAQCR